MDDDLISATSDLRLDDGEAKSNSDLFADVVRRSHRVRDVTKELQDATTALRIGQLIKNDTFTLFESVQALEIMDPKMDSGYLEPGDTIDDNFDLGKALLPEQVLGIIDQLLRYEVAWHQGYPLSQTLLTSLHLDALLDQKDRPTGLMPLFLPTSLTDEEREGNALLHLVLRAYCIGVIKSCDIAVEMIASSMYFEEEDFCSQTYGRELLTDVSDDECVQFLNDAVVWVGENLPNEKASFKKPLLSRLFARQDFIKAFLPAPNRPTPKAEFENGKHLLENIRATHELGMPVKDAFSNKMHRRLASTAPPRPSIELSFEETCDRLANLYDDLLRVLDVVGYDGGVFGLRTFLWSFASRVPQPSTFSRAFLQTMTVAQGQIASIEEAGRLVEEDLRLATANGLDLLNPAYWAVEHPNDVRFKVAHAVNLFWQQAASEYNKLFQCLCQNRCRIRRSLVNVLENFDILLGNLRAAAAAETDDGLLLAARETFVVCTEMQLYQTISWVLQLGFEQDLMQPYEIAAGYWTLGRILMQTEMGYAEAADEEDYLVNPPDRTAAEMARMFQAYDLATDVLSSNDQLAFALYEFYNILTRLDLLPSTPPALPFSTPATQWETRMRPLLTLKHATAIPNLSEYTKMQTTDASTPVTQLFARATSTLANAKEGFTDLRRAFTADAVPDGRKVGALRSEQAHEAMLRASEKTCVRVRLALHVLEAAVARFGEGGLKGKIGIVLPAVEKRDLGCWIVPEVRNL